MNSRALPLVPLLLLVACGGGTSTSPSDSDTGDCSVPGQVEFVRDTLRDFYYWYRELPDPHTSAFSSPESYLDAVRYRPLDITYSYITSRAASDAFFSASQFIGFGVSYRQTSPTQLRVAQVYPESPAASAGLARGDYLLAVGGRSVADLLLTGSLASAFGPEEVGVTVTIGWSTPAGLQREATLTKTLVTIPTVSATAVLDVGSSRVGYVFFRNFVQPSIAALDAAFSQLRDEGVTDLVLDLRYNGGGLVDVAKHLAGLIGGAGTAGRVFVEFRHNDKHTDLDSSVVLEDPEAALDLPRLFVIQTGGSASASEAVVNGLRPYMTVTTIGAGSFGKPVGQYGFEFCDKVLYPVCFLVTNSRGEADYFGGIPADCAAGDDLDHMIGDPAESSLAEALWVLRTGRCSRAAAAEAELQARQRGAWRDPLAGDPWRQLIGAF